MFLTSLSYAFFSSYYLSLYRLTVGAQKKATIKPGPEKQSSLEGDLPLYRPLRKYIKHSKYGPKHLIRSK